MFKIVKYTNKNKIWWNASIGRPLIIKGVNFRGKKNSIAADEGSAIIAGSN